MTEVARKVGRLAMERPILFSTEMIKAILREENPKTVTRRVITPQPILDKLGWAWFPGNSPFAKVQTDSKSEKAIAIKLRPYYPYGKPGDRLWVKETWQAYNLSGESYSSLVKEKKAQAELYNWAVVSKATNPEDKPLGDPWIPSIFMPRWASAITLEITDVRVERIQEITPYQAEAEGIQVSHYYCDEGVPPDFIPTHRCDPIGKFRELWDSINAKRGYGWDVNPWVRAIEFKRVTDDNS